jgi:hypothetical protein
MLASWMPGMFLLLYAGGFQSVICADAVEAVARAVTSAKIVEESILVSHGVSCRAGVPLCRVSVVVAHSARVRREKRCKIVV